MVQTNIPGAVGVSTTPSTALQERKRIAGLAKNIGMRTHEDLLARTEEDRLRARGANVQQQLENDGYFILSNVLSSQECKHYIQIIENCYKKYSNKYVKKIV